MVLVFSSTTPTGITIGIAISKSYNEYSPKALIVQGSLNLTSAGILIYMALVDLLATDFMNPKLLSNFKLQLGTNLALLFVARWTSNRPELIREENMIWKNVSTNAQVSSAAGKSERIKTHQRSFYALNLKEHVMQQWGSTDKVRIPKTRPSEPSSDIP
ncbi:hypothetical protein M9H77_09209 [Catharanthus roseus]|uniref:Uncharacterized protein n=1 Tax=Catharanthus roseus TaxID=4058 RepID=A0ACC0BZY1_CATRO|nr:hypothetical protein M9H77_09209 [Catharanthus roseus]